MTELEIFAKNIIESGGEFWTLETCTKGKLAKTVTHYMVRGHEYNEVRFQVFNKEGKRIFVDTSLATARSVYNSMIEGSEKK